MKAQILVTMEHKEQMKLISDCLEKFGHCVIQADTFHKSMEVLKCSDIDLIISDVHLQNGGSVFDFLRWTKGDPYLRSVPFVCFSAEPPEIGKYLADGVRTAARALGAVRYLTMEHFDANVFRQEIEWLLPAEKVGTYYADQFETDSH
ncbi:MAG: hypothetical protein K2X93_12110 [Candidatus Obscuribacterales bacterium]|nr:hypothetical protein [Candidatus Obscuribacterales bacterium]